MIKPLAAGLVLGTAIAVAVPLAAQSLAGHNTDAPVDVEADRIEVQDRADRAIFAGDVRVRQGDLNMTAERLTVAYSRAGGNGLQIQRLDATGGVVVRSPSETARGRHGIYDLNRRQITLIGGVVLDQGANSVRGGRLVIDLDSGRAVVDGAAATGNGPATPGTGGRVTGRFTVPQRKGS